MAAGKLAIKARIRSVDSTMKITKAMQLVATSKLKKQKAYMEENREYASYLKEISADILSSVEGSMHPYLMKNDADKPYTIAFTSDMGLCGGYNANVYRMLQSEIAKEDPIVMIGSRGCSWIHNKGYTVVDMLGDLEDDDCYADLVQIADHALELYRKKEISEIRILYTKFMNSVSFEPVLMTLLPIPKEEGTKKEHKETLFEPKGDKILDDLVPLYIRSLLYSCYLETKTSEQASRRMAMESATDNADELKQTLELQFNQARQAAITQEITEIVGGVNALE